MKKIEDFIKELNEKFKPAPGKEKFHQVFIGLKGRKYVKLCKSNDGVNPSSAYGFIDIKTGDLFKAASFAQPAKHARGNINDNTALDACGAYSVAYLRG